MYTTATGSPAAAVSDLTGKMIQVITPGEVIAEGQIFAVVIPGVRPAVWVVPSGKTHLQLFQGCFFARGKFFRESEDVPWQLGWQANDFSTLHWAEKGMRKVNRR